jgi:hypothetical protein
MPWTRYVGHKERDANVPVKYSDPDRSRTKLIRTYPYWVHMEWIVTGTAALKGVGVNDFADLLAVERREFWMKHLLFADIDRGKLGRALRNRAAPGRRAWCRDPVCDGGVLFRAAQTELRRDNPLSASQAVITHYPLLPVVSECLIPLPTDHLLPSPGSFLRSGSLYIDRYR